jgi:hypothetical protein
LLKREEATHQALERQGGEEPLLMEDMDATSEGIGVARVTR